MDRLPLCPGGPGCLLLQVDQAHGLRFNHGISSTRTTPPVVTVVSHSSLPLCPGGLGCQLLPVDPGHAIRFSHGGSIGPVQPSFGNSNPSTHTSNPQPSHLPLCPGGSSCPLLSVDAGHGGRFDHGLVSRPVSQPVSQPLLVAVPSLCPLDGSCQDMSPSHRDAARHTCKYGRTCSWIQGTDGGAAVHRRRYVHPGEDTPSSPQPYPSYPSSFSAPRPSDGSVPDLSHVHISAPVPISGGFPTVLVKPTHVHEGPPVPSSDYKGFGQLPVCAGGYDCPRLNDLSHYLRHPCAKGSSCTVGDDSFHSQKFFHHQIPCPDGNLCLQQVSVLHMQWYTHPTPRSSADSSSTPMFKTVFRGKASTNITLPTCTAGDSCTSTDHSHLRQYSHTCRHRDDAPRGCRKVEDDEHTKCYLHGEIAADNSNPNRRVPPCFQGWQCTDVLTSKKHEASYTHPCRDGASCPILRNNKDPQHLFHVRVYKHPCPLGAGCQFIKGSASSSAGTAPSTATGADTTAADEALEMHKDRFIHPCMFGIGCKNVSNPYHVARFHHPCYHGDQCSHMNDQRHIQHASHPCPKGRQCADMDPMHNILYTHTYGLSMPTSDLLSKDPVAAELLVSFALSCIADAPERFNPYPASVSVGSSHYFMKGMDRDDDKLKSTIAALPAVSEMIAGKTEVALKSRVTEPGYALLSWLFESFEADWRSLTSSERISSMKTDYQFAMINSSLERKRNFQTLKSKYGSFYAWHGSGIANWHAILREGLRNLSGTKLMSTGAIYGDGIYLAPMSGVSFGYAKPGKAWAKSVFGTDDLQILCLCEVVNFDSSYAAKPHHVVPDENHVMIRMMFVYRNGKHVDCEARSMGAKIPKTINFNC